MQKPELLSRTGPSLGSRCAAGEPTEARVITLAFREIWAESLEIQTVWIWGVREWAGKEAHSQSHVLVHLTPPNIRDLSKNHKLLVPRQRKETQKHGNSHPGPKFPVSHRHSKPDNKDLFTGI